MTCKHICRNCKHWGGEIMSIVDMVNGKYGHKWSKEDAVAWVTKSRAEDTNKWECKVITEEVEVDIDQGGGWDSGGASVDVINTSGDFGCIKWEKWEGT